MNAFPTEINAWKNDVARRLVALRGGINDLIMNMPMIPDPEIGQPFTGPLSPVPFVFPPVTNTGGTLGTQYTVANHCPSCPQALRYYEITVSGITNRGTCTLCNSANGSFTLEALDGKGGSGTPATNLGIQTCTWASTQKFQLCGGTVDKDFRWWLVVFSSTNSRLYLADDPLGVIRAEYRFVGCPPGAGSGSGTVSFSRLANFLNSCQTYPLTIPLRGVS